MTSLNEIRDKFDTEFSVPVQAIAHATMDDQSEVNKMVDIFFKSNTTTTYILKTLTETHCITGLEAKIKDKKNVKKKN